MHLIIHIDLVTSVPEQYDVLSKTISRFRSPPGALIRWLVSTRRGNSQS